MRLAFLVPNAAWAFTFGDDLVRMGDGPMFFGYRWEAVEAARACGLLVTKGGAVYGAAS